MAKNMLYQSSYTFVKTAIWDKSPKLFLTVIQNIKQLYITKIVFSFMSNNFSFISLDTLNKDTRKLYGKLLLVIS